MGLFESLRIASDELVTPEAALPGRQSPLLDASISHTVLGTPLAGPWAKNTRVIYLAMGCFWGAEELFWAQPGVVCTAVGYMGGTTPHPTYTEVCTGRTGHTETVLVAYNPTLVNEFKLMTLFWENHDPTTAFRQGNDVGTQYRSAAYWTTPTQQDVLATTVEQYQDALSAAGYGTITTECRPAMEAGPFFYAEENHQQFLAKFPQGYRCHAATGIRYPARKSR